jgi:nucleoside phosphorylase
MRRIRQPDDNAINLVIALPAEAKPLIKQLNLRRDQANMKMPVYSDNRIMLVITGPGANASAQGVQYLRSINASSATQWINIGICGHGSLEIGTPLLIDRIIDQRSGREWSLAIHPMMVDSIGTLTCVSEPQSEYAVDMAYDMESSGFIKAVTESDTLESATVFKIVSDNPDHGARGISGKFVRALVQKQLGLIRSLIEGSE